MKNKDLKGVDILYAEVEYTIDKMKQKQVTYATLYRVSKILTFVAGALITVIVGWDKGAGAQHELDFYFFTINSVNAILIISAGISLLAAFEGLLNFKDKSMSYDFILFDMRRLRDRICFDYVNNKALYNSSKAKYFSDFHQILESQKSLIKDSYEEQ